MERNEDDRLEWSTETRREMENRDCEGNTSMASAKMAVEMRNGKEPQGRVRPWKTNRELPELVDEQERKETPPNGGAPNLRAKGAADTSLHRLLKGMVEDKNICRDGVPAILTRKRPAHPT